MADENHEFVNDASAPRGSSAALTAGLLTGLAVGALVGAVSMLLLAPQSGKRTRAKLQRQTRELREQTADTVEDAVAQAHVTARQITGDVRKQAEELEQRGHAIISEHRAER